MRIATEQNAPLVFRIGRFGQVAFLCLLAVTACTRSIPPRPVPPEAFAFAPLHPQQGWEIPADARLSSAPFPALPPTPYRLSQQLLMRGNDQAQVNADGTLDWRKQTKTPLAVLAFAESPHTGFVYLILPPEARAPKGRMLELVPPTRRGEADATATRFDAGLFLQGGDPAVETDHAFTLAPAKAGSIWLALPHALAAGADGTLWVAAKDGATGREAVFVLPTEGGWRGRPWLFLRAPDAMQITALAQRGRHLHLLTQDADGRARGWAVGLPEAVAK